MGILSALAKTSNIVIDTDYLTPPTSIGGSSFGSFVWIIVSLILSIVGGVLVYFLFIKKDTKLKSKFLQWLKSFLDFKVMWIESLLKVIYYMGTIFMILVSFAFIGDSFLVFLLCLVFGPVILRLIYEGFMMYIMIWRNTKDIAENTKK